MSSDISIREKDSVGQQTNNERCPECGGRTRTVEAETHCAVCGLVVADEKLDRGPSAGAHGPTRRKGPEEWSVEPTTELRVRKGLGGKFNLGKDGNGNPLSSKKRSRLGRMRRLDRRMTTVERRLNEALRDVEMIGGNLGLPDHVVTDAARALRDARAQGVPCGRMSWEALAGGAIALYSRNEGVSRELAEIATVAKASHERVSAGARKLRLDLGLSVPPARARPVDNVLDALGDEIESDAAKRYGRIARHLLDLGDERKIGPGTPRQTVAAAAVYAADRLTPGKRLTQAQVVAAGSEIVETSKHRIGRYSRELYDAYVEVHGTETVTRVPA